jgi:AcrR family transcriptional regulator
VRAIAARAGVNHGLIHRHFGSKEDLLRAVLDGLPPRIAQALDLGSGRQGGAAGVIFASSELMRLFARAVLDGDLPNPRQREFPVMQRLVDTYREMRARGELAPEFEPRLVAAVTVAHWLGWMAFEPFLVRAAGLDDADLGVVRARFLVASGELIRRLR